MVFRKDNDFILLQVTVLLLFSAAGAEHTNVTVLRDAHELQVGSVLRNQLKFTVASAHNYYGFYRTHVLLLC